MSKISDFLGGLVTDDYHSYPGLFKKQKHSTGLDMFFDYQYVARLQESVDRKYDLDNINL